MPLKTIFAACLPLLLAAVIYGAEFDVRVAQAAMNGDNAAVRALIDDKADVNTPLADGTTALHWVVRAGDVVTVDLLIRGGANVNRADRYGLTPLSIACSNADAAIVRKLLDAGADMNSADPNGETPLMTAAQTGNIDAAVLGHVDVVLLSMRAIRLFLKRH